MEKDQKVLHFKVILLGNTAVGKSSLLNRYTRQVFAEEYDATIGVEFGSRTVTLQGGVPVKLMIWDTAGQESFRSIIRTYYRNVGTVFLVFDLTDKKSLQDLRSWIVEAREHTEEGTAYILVGNKKDMDSKSHQVSKEDAVRFKNQFKLDEYMECSAKLDSGVEQLFLKGAEIMVARRLVQHVKFEELRVSQELERKKKTVSNCC